MKWIVPVVQLLFLSPFILVWFIVWIATGIENGWKKALRVGLITLPILLIAAVVICGRSFLAEKSYNIIKSGVCIIISAGFLYLIFVRFLAVVQGQTIWVDSKPVGFTEVNGLRFNAVSLLYGLFLSVFAGSQIGDALRTTSRIPVEWFELLMLMSWAGHKILTAFLRFQIRKKGIITSEGRLLRWASIIKYEFVKYQDRVKLEIRRWLIGHRTVMVQIPSEHRAVLEEYLTKYVGRT